MRKILALLGLLILGGSFMGFAQKSPITILIHPTVYEETGGQNGVIAAFTARTGIPVKVVTLPITELHSKALLDWIAGSDNYDIVTVLTEYLDPSDFKYLEPLDSRIAALPSSYDFNDIIPSLLSPVRSEGKTYGLPFQGGTGLFFYRSDLFNKYGIEVPTTLDGVLKAARVLKAALREDGNTDTYPIALRAKSADVGTQDFLTVFYAYGGKLFGDDGQTCGLDSPAGVETGRFFKTLVDEKLAPPNLLAIGRDELIGGFQQGRFAMTFAFSTYLSAFNDPKASKVSGDVGYAVIPTAPGVQKGRGFENYWYTVLNKKSKNKDAAWQLMLELSSKDAQIKMASQWGFGPVRNSSFESPEVQAAAPQASAWQKSASASVAPVHSNWAQISDIIFEGYSGIISGDEAPDKAVKSMCEGIDPLL